ncbi:hypothetical protein BJ878DRAFT_526904 [Calycina marina]|uniref:Uncharacterized protein n=1 Tax=Calycina marina TaxID=1763456 RepID=A0A9P8CAW8_9HELO|nr:hypothetical protein BJ878DRAFT_526904 [Calycina marina]
MKQENAHQSISVFYSPMYGRIMKHEDILLPKAPLFLVHKGWSSRQQQRATAEETQGDTKALIPENSNGNGNVRIWTFGRQQNLASSGKREDEKGAAKLSGEQRPGTSDAAGHFLFVNTARPDCLSDPQLRKLVMSNVKTGVKRGPNMSKAPKSKYKSTTDHSGPNIDATTERGPRHLKLRAGSPPRCTHPYPGFHRHSTAV